VRRTTCDACWIDPAASGFRQKIKEIVLTHLSNRSLAAGLVAALCVLAPGESARAQEVRASAREVVTRWQDAIVNIRVVIKMRMSVGGREMQSSDETVEGVGTIIDPSGLTVVALSSLNPGEMMSKLMGGGGTGEQRVDIASEPTDVKMRLSDGREVAASIALRDVDLNLAFIRPTRKADKPFVAVNLTDAAKPALLDQVVVLSRLGRVGGWVPSAALQEVGAVIERPRSFFVLSGTPGSMGTPAFLPNGKVVGVLTMRQIDAGRTGMMAMMGGTEGLGLLPVILPAADVLEIARQAMEKQ
jgi:S1-C subfamily serine protease